MFENYSIFSISKLKYNFAPDKVCSEDANLNIPLNQEITTW